MRDHRIALLYDFTFSPRMSCGSKIADLRVRDIASHDWIHPSRLAPEVQRPIGARAIWEWAAWDISPELHPFVHEILDSSHENADKPRCLRLTSYGRNVVSGRYRSEVAFEPGGRTSGERLLLELSALSEATVGDRAVPIVIDDVSLHTFETGFGIAVVTLHIERSLTTTLAHTTIIEALPRLCDERGTKNLYWITADEKTQSINAANFTLGGMIADLIEPAGCKLTKRERSYSVSAVVFDEKIPEQEKRDLAFRLSRHYTFRYHPQLQMTGTFFAHPFETVLHAMSREGACTIVDFVGDAGKPIEFIGTWLQQSHPKVYVPLQVAVYHEHVVLLDLAQGAGRSHSGLSLKRISDESVAKSSRNRRCRWLGTTRRAKHITDTKADERRQLRQLGDRFLLFRLRHRLSQVSRLTTHDLAYAASEQALGLPALSEKIGRDMLAVERRLIDYAAEAAEEAAKNVERRWAIPLSIGSAALTFVSLNAAVKLIQEIYASEIHGTTDVFRLGIEFVIIALTISAFNYTRTRQRGGTSDEERISEHERSESALAAADEQ